MCHFTSSAAQALEIINTQPVDVLISDLVMPEMGGLELLTTVQQDFPHIVRLVLSGQSQVPSILAAINTGQVFRYLTKPWHVDAGARSIIAEAVAYANELNQFEPKYLQVPLERIVQLLQLRGAKFLLMGRDGRIITFSPDLQERWPPGCECATQRERLTQEGAQLVELDLGHAALVWPAAR